MVGKLPDEVMESEVGFGIAVRVVNKRLEGLGF